VIDDDGFDVRGQQAAKEGHQEEQGHRAAAFLHLLFRDSHQADPRLLE